jgi:hypothetical protein
MFTAMTHRHIAGLRSRYHAIGILSVTEVVALD